MARPRVFVSSTYYDLKHIRSSLELFIESVGYEPILSEKGDIAYVPDLTLDESCYREAASADVFVLVIGGRYGSEVSGDQKPLDRSFFERYESITRKEFETAHSADIPIFILIESGVYSEYYTYTKNRQNESIKYAHVDSVNVFKLIDDILTKRKNNPVFPFERSSQIEAWLRDQWAGLFRELLKSRSQQRQLMALTGQVGELKVINETLKKYLEAVMTGISRDDSSRLIATEEKRIHTARQKEQLENNMWFSFMMSNGLNFDQGVALLSKSGTAAEFDKGLRDQGLPAASMAEMTNALRLFAEARRDFNAARKILDLPPATFKAKPRPKPKPGTKAPKASTAKAPSKEPAP